MASPIDLKLVLCQSAAADSVQGTLHMLGAGWSITSSPTAPQAVALLIKVPWDRSNQQLHIVVELLDADGRAVSLPGPADDQQPIRAEADLEVGRPPGLAPGTPLDASLALNFPSMPLPAGRYQWRVAVADDVEHESFTVRTSA